MFRQLPIFLQVMLLASLAVRLAVGAPCCWSAEIEHIEAAQTHKAMAGMHDAGEHGGDTEGGHSGHEEGDNTAGPCCSACGPVLANGKAPLLAAAVAPPVPLAFTLEDLPQRDLLRLYEATGPPLHV